MVKLGSTSFYVDIQYVLDHHGNILAALVDNEKAALDISALLNEKHGMHTHTEVSEAVEVKINIGD